MRGAIPLLPPPLSVISWHVHNFAILSYNIYFTLDATEYFCPLCICNPRSKMTVKIQLDAPVFLTTLAFNHKVGE